MNVSIPPLYFAEEGHTIHSTPEYDVLFRSVLAHLDIPKEKRNLQTASYDYSVQFLYGLMAGSIYTLIALGFSLIYFIKVREKRLMNKVPLNQFYYSLR